MEINKAQRKYLGQVFAELLSEQKVWKEFGHMLQGISRDVIIFHFNNAPLKADKSENVYKFSLKYIIPGTGDEINLEKNIDAGLLEAMK